ncbi:hypothetical protein [Vallitalea guaymasensis]|uniref:hypothetical protein n=1 Tax=Vallitalea guaymasensis TaxID=1185412 RepID=UPI002357A374|nr:hypothetical protein [Vallitalea guaymasensis]
MNWSHIVVESYCSFKNDNLAEKPICCKYNPGITGLHCLAYDSQNNNYCPYLGFGTAKTTIVLTNQKGETINFDSFFGDLDLSKGEWEKKEKEWIKKQNEYISNNDNA